MPVSATNFHKIAASTTSEILRQERIDEHGFIALNETKTDSLNPIDPVTMIEDTHKLWLNNPLAFRFIETQNNYVVGDGITFEATDESVQKVLQDFWDHPANNMGMKHFMRMRDLSMNGELILEPNITPHAGDVVLNNLYPANAHSFVHDSKNYEQIDRFKYSAGSDDIPKKIIRWIDTKDGAGYEGDAFFFSINKTSFQTRGLSDVYFYRDWLRLYDKSLYTTTKRSGLLLSFIWDIVLEGAGTAELKAKEKAIVKNPPVPGSWRVHNEKEKWNELTPDLKGADLRKVYDLIKTQILAGSGMPEWFYGVGESTNLATARVMGAPFYRQIKGRQGYSVYMISTIFDFVIWVKKQKGELPEDVDATYTIGTPEPDTEKAHNLAETISKYATAIMVMETNGYITRQEAQSVFKLLLGQVGVDVGISEEDDTVNDAMAAASKYIKKFKRA